KRKREAGKMGDETPLAPTKGKRVGKAEFNWTPTSDLRKPWPRSYFLWAAAIAALISAGGVFALDHVYSPGQISDAHSKTEGNLKKFAVDFNGSSCTACHGVADETQAKCESCHTTSTFKPVIYDAHQREGVSCTQCHSEHQGPSSASGLLA